MKNPFTGRFRARDEPRNRAGIMSTAMEFLFGGSTAGQNVTPRTAVQVSTVYACVRIIAETVASLPLHVYENGKGGKSQISDHPMDFLLHAEPNPEMTSFNWRETVLSHLLLWGNSYNQLIRDGAGRVLAIYPLLPDRMTVERDEKGRLKYRYSLDDGREKIMDTDECWHIPGLGFDGLVGYSPIAMMRNALGLTLAAEEYGSTFFRNGARPAGILTHPGTIKNPEKVRSRWQEAYGGENRGRVAVLEEGMKYEPIALPNNEAQFLETRKFQVAEICRIYRVPPHMVAELDRATFSNIEHQSIDFAKHTINPWLVRIEQSADRSLFPYRERRKYYTKFNLDGLMRGDYKSRMDGYAVARQNGWMNADDIRALENMDPLPPGAGGDLYLVNGNMIALKSAAENMVGSGAQNAGEEVEQ